MEESVKQCKLETVPCDLCGSNSFSVLFGASDWFFQCPGRFEVVECTSCGLTYLNPRPSKYDISKYYPSEYYTHIKQHKSSDHTVNERDSSKLKNCIKQNFKSYFNIGENAPTPFSRIVSLSILILARQRVITPQRWGLLDCKGTLLDVGCGSGEFLQNLQADWMTQDRFYSMGIDIDPKAVKAARSRGIDARVHQFPDSPFPETGYDVITIRHSLEHMRSPTAAIREVWRLLRPGGKVVIEVPNIDSIGPWLAKDRWSALDAPRHLYHFSETTLKKLLVKNSFQVLSTCRWPGTFKSDLTIANLSRYYEALDTPNGARKRKLFYWKTLFFITDHLVRGGAVSIAAKRLG